MVGSAAGGTVNAPPGKGVTAMAGLTTGFQLSRQQAEMLDELKAYLDENSDPSHECHDGTPEWGSEEEFQWYREFNRKLFEDGWLCPQWPQKYGGRGLTPVDQMLIKEEFAYRRVGLCNANGLQMLCPILLIFGTEEQKDRTWSRSPEWRKCGARASPSRRPART